MLDAQHSGNRWGLLCSFGTDCSDCGEKNAPVMTDAVHMGGSLSTCVHPVTGASQTNNEVCQDGGHGSEQADRDDSGNKRHIGEFLCDYGTE